MFIVTGGAGFIGSALIWKLNQLGITDILVVDRMGHGGKWKNLSKLHFSTIYHKNDFLSLLGTEVQGRDIDGVFHLGACSSTTETDVDYLAQNNLNFSIALWRFCTNHGIPYIYASSAATYGDGQLGFSDDLAMTPKLRALNPYGFSKLKFDQWAIRQKLAPPFWAGVKFFNVYGPNEYHKGGQSSVINHFVPQVRSQGSIKLFKSYRPDYKDGGQLRDFVYVKDCIDVMWHLYENSCKAESGTYNIGSGEARSFLDVAHEVFKAMNINSPQIQFIDMPEALRGQYQYYTKADLTRLREKAGYTKPMHDLASGVSDYVRSFLCGADPYL